MDTWDVKLFFIIGVLSVTYWAARFFQFIALHLRPSSISRYCHSNDGKPAWALVTGASDGIGRSFAIELANRGFNVIIHGRNPKKLQRVKEEILTESPERSVRIEIIEASVDGSKMVGEIGKLAESTRDLNLTVLINAVGGIPGYVPPFETFDKTTPRTIDAFTTMNVDFPIHTTSALLPTLLEHQPALIMTIGSMGDAGIPWTSLYGASKAFQMSWCKGIAREMKAEGRDIEILGVQTAIVTSVSFRKNPSTLFEPDATTYVKATLGKVGCGQTIVTGYWAHAVLKTMTDYMPDWLFSRILIQGMEKERLHEDDYNNRIKSD